METLKKKLELVGLHIPHILLPSESIDLKKFSCIAADQFTQDVRFWERVKEYIEDSPSTYNLIYPEAYLEEAVNNDKDNFDNILQNKIADIRSNMDNYINKSIYQDIGECFIYVERKCSSGIRKGLVVAIDLEQYDYNKGAKTLMRATELTVKERLVVRRKIRENATLDMPHIMVLINDKKNALFDYVESAKNENLKCLYDFDLMDDSGHIKGFKIDDESVIENIADILIDLKNNSNDNLLYAVGDGNHSLAAAKDVYDKTGKGRYVLVELVNIHDEGLAFYPIHRLIIGENRESFIKETGIDPDNPPALQDLQNILDNHKYKIDYIHGLEECLKLGKKDNNIAIVYDKFSYETLFDDVVKYGSLCRKSFSMGEAKDKRFYLEAQKIV